MDEKVIPVRGQTVLVRNEADIMAVNSGTDDGDDESCYVMQRAAGQFRNEFVFCPLRASDHPQAAAHSLEAPTKKVIGIPRSTFPLRTGS